MTIPKILHFTWKTKTLTRFFQAIFDRWKATHPDWEIRLYDDADIRALVAEHYPEQLALFDSYPSGIYRADAFRFFVLHRFGGIYADLDVEPLRHLDELIVRTDCFVGSEPEQDVAESDAMFRGMPFRLCNAFMGSVPGHPFWALCIDRLADCLCGDVVDSTGPRFLNGIALCAPRELRPDVLPPNYWSPLRGTGAPSVTTPGYVDALAGYFTIVGRDEPALVSHLWRNSWNLKFAYKGPQFWRWPNRLQWAWRAFRNPGIANARIPAPRVDYDRQNLPEPKAIPLLVAVDCAAGAPGAALVASLAALDYPRDRLRFLALNADASALAALSALGSVTGIDADDESGRVNAVLGAAQPGEGCVLIGADLVTLPPDSLLSLLAADRPVVTADIDAADGGEGEPRAYLYEGEIFKLLYRQGARDGLVKAGPARQRVPLRNFRAWAVAPLSTVGTRLLLIRPEVIAAGVRFAATPYKMHAGGEGFALAARDAGFEVCGLPGLRVRRAG